MQLLENGPGESAFKPAANDTAVRERRKAALSAALLSDVDGTNEALGVRLSCDEERKLGGTA
ncbi:hypothetical protein Back11_24840 [Paenibacillus baekrokdamisoli]|uniref:Uncharacterized protein n=1 Tax=Paenibacillus baekrokdamisoli TaxID=1712516 RepID=A0A3G9JDQ2_9BACL|nr:hypothetical protein [Paenibacillus baekrokdamisoli]MBB3070127.1 hypothetical protein [Paenibacillus baekrokdamisoli]BBH21139.1 hypothetical protein Back11_24840 [Paenibacillus baekrokdamisoli]